MNLLNGKIYNSLASQAQTLNFSYKFKVAQAVQKGTHSIIVLQKSSKKRPLVMAARVPF
ncbi:hypothetical protein X874_16400 [Mannheimia varigena USDA-ARS-USMARC-1312]|nr:hypothetical protein X874_16400 [Mannheimia varigena USDA-ARS-USMARC-1312]